MIEVVFFIPFNSGSKQGQLPSAKEVLGRLVIWKCLTAAKYLLMVCHLSPFKVSYTPKSSNCCSEAGRGGEPLVTESQVIFLARSICSSC